MIHLPTSTAELHRALLEGITRPFGPAPRVKVAKRTPEEILVRSFSHGLEEMQKQAWLLPLVAANLGLSAAGTLGVEGMRRLLGYQGSSVGDLATDIGTGTLFGTGLGAVGKGLMGPLGRAVGNTAEGTIGGWLARKGHGLAEMMAHPTGFPLENAMVEEGGKRFLSQGFKDSLKKNMMWSAGLGAASTGLTHAISGGQGAAQQPTPPPVSDWAKVRNLTPWQATRLPGFQS